MPHESENPAPPQLPPGQPTDFSLSGRDTLRPLTRADNESSLLLNLDAHQTPENSWSAGVRGEGERPLPAIPGYEVQQELGRGGMGIVYLAVQSRLSRPVALKMVLDSRFASEQGKKRFLAEAEALAKLRHPNIVQVHECGQWDGHPFFSLELVDGGSLDRFLGGRPQEPRKAAAFVAQIADGMQAAHDQGIIHRDLKPANVLLASKPTSNANEEPERAARLRATSRQLTPGLITRLEDATPKVSDFGLAKNLAAGLGLTASGEVLGTPHYMAPEQALGQKQVSAAIDVYALGAILYEMLTGRPPFLGDDPLQVLLQVVSESPAPPRLLRPEIPADLETICLKCLAREPAERYASAAALAEDLRRFLDHRTIAARPATRWERTVKWCRRYPAAAALIAVSTLAAGASIGMALWVNAARQEALSERDAKEWQRMIAEQAKAEAEVRAAESLAMLQFFSNRVLAAAKPEDQEGGLGREVKLKEAIRAALPYLENSFKKQPLVEARLRAIIGQVFYELGEIDVAEASVIRARQLFTAHAGPSHQETLDAVNLLAACRSAQGRHQEARQLHEEVLRHCRANLGPEHASTLASMQNLAVAWGDLGHLDKSRELLEEVLRVRRQVLGPEHFDTIHAMDGYATCLMALGRYDEARDLYEKVLYLRRTHGGVNHPATVHAMLNLANVYGRLRRTAEACKLEEEALRSLEKRLGADHPRTLISMNNLAQSYCELGRHDDALELSREVLRRRQAKLGATHPDTLASMHNIAVICFEIGRFDEALKVNQETLRLRRQHLEKDHPDTLMTMNNVAFCLTALGRHEEAIKLYDETLPARRRKLGADHPDVAETMGGKANSCEALGRHAEALDLYLEVWRVRKARFGAVHADTLACRWGIIESLMALKRSAEALPHVDETLREALEAEAKGQMLLQPMIPRLFELRLMLSRELGDAAGCLKLAELWEKLDRGDVAGLLCAACLRAVASELLARGKTTDAAELARDQADLAMRWLERAVAAGWNNGKQTERNPYLRVLHDRADFKKLLKTMSPEGSAPSVIREPRP